MRFRRRHLRFLFPHLSEHSRSCQAGRGDAEMGGLGQAGDVEHRAGDGGDLTGQPLESLRPHLVDVTHIMDEVHDVLHVIINLTYRVDLHVGIKHAK